MSENGKFIVLEGIDRSGKSTLVDGLYHHLENMGFDVFLTDEPTSFFDERFSSLYENEPSPETEFPILTSLFLKDREIHNRTIKEKLSEGKIVLCVRYSLSTFAYQGVYFRKYFPDDNSFFEWMLTFMKMFHINPDLTIFIDFNSKMFMERGSRGKRYLLFEKEQYLSEVYGLYRMCVERKALSLAYLNIPGRLNIEEMRDIALNEVIRIIKE